jgi:hypothetical protein
LSNEYLPDPPQDDVVDCWKLNAVDSGFCNLRQACSRGHLKTDNLMSRCFLKGQAGDSINAVLGAAGSNLMELLREIAHSLIFRLSGCVVNYTAPAVNRCQRKIASR